MKIEHFGGSVTVGDDAVLDEILAARYGDGGNEFWLSWSERYPLLSIMVRGAVACLHYFPNQYHPGFISVGVGQARGAVTFFTNTPTEEIEVAGDSVVPFRLAEKAAHEFLHSMALPTSIQWLEL